MVELGKSNDKENKYKVFLVSKDDTLLNWLLNNVEGYSRNKIKDVLRGKGIFVNGRCITKFDYPLKAGMKVSVSQTKRDNTFRSPYIKIVYEDRYLIVVDKREGVLSMAAGHSSLNVKIILDDYFERTRQKCRAHIVHRLDRDTSGLLVYAKDIKAEQILINNWHEMVFDRRYVAVVSGVIPDEGGTVRSYLKDNGSYFTYSSWEDNGGKYAVTHFEVLKRAEAYSLVEYKLETGRKNQIRVHSAEIGFPICGDIKYGNGDDPVGRLCLHAYALGFYHPITGEKMEFKTDIPSKFRKVFV